MADGDRPAVPSPVTAPGSPPTLQVENISKTFPGQRALTDVSMTVEQGRVHALLGQNGSGKSTLIKILDGYHDPDPGGVVRINGTAIERDRAATAHRLGLRCVHQNLGLIDEFNAVENFGLTDGYPNRHGVIDWSTAQERVDGLLQRIGVELDLDKPMSKCAPVERTAVAVARAIADLTDAQRGCLLLDEPTAALASSEVDRLFAIISQLTDQGVSIIYVSHRLDEIFAIGDDVTTLRGGYVVRSTEVASLTRAELVRDITGSDRSGPARVERVPAGGDAVLRVTELAGAELQGVSFGVGRGEILGVAGLVGSGRAELGFLLGGFDAPRDGSVDVLDDTGGPAGEGIALVPSDRLGQAAVADFSVRENLTLGDLRPFRRGWLRRTLESAFAEDWMERLEIRPPDAERNFVTLSGGNQQKAVLAKWLGVAPRVLVVDEPTAGVDVGARDKIYGLLREQADGGLAIVVCSSDLDELTLIADRVLVLREGRIAQEFRGDEITSASIMLAMTGIDEDA